MNRSLSKFSLPIIFQASRNRSPRRVWRLADPRHRINLLSNDEAPGCVSRIISARTDSGSGTLINSRRS